MRMKERERERERERLVLFIMKILYDHYGKFVTHGETKVRQSCIILTLKDDDELLKFEIF
jgi:hypothetical protein